MDDHALFRAGVVKLLQDMADVEVVGEAADGRPALELVDTLHPDVVIMDLAMRAMNGLEATAAIHARHGAVKVIVLTMHANEEYVQAALKAGASAYVLKHSTPEELRLAIEAVAQGGIFLSAEVSGDVAGAGPDAEGQTGSHPHLTRRQKEVLRLLARGKSTKEIALALNLSIKTIESHRAELMERLHIANAAALVRYAARLSPLFG
ncbi:MAG: response regulator transcription factor [Gammaproteobacteria bacterium]